MMERRLRWLLLAAGCMALARPAAAQDAATTPASIAGGYAYVHEQGIGGAPAVTYDKGWLVAVDVRLKGRVSVVGEAGGTYRSIQGVETQSLYGFLGGLRFGLVRIGPAHVFAQGLVGLERFVEPGFSESGLAIQPGAGIALALTHRLGILGQADYRFAREEGVTFKEVRGAFSVVWHLGSDRANGGR